MSQEKVDKYKEYKANKKKIWKKEKMMHRLEMSIIAVVCIAFIGWVGFSIYDKAVNPDDALANAVQLDTSAIEDYLSNLSVE